MKLAWMGRYRELIRQLMRYNNLFSRNYDEEVLSESGIAMSTQQWQTMECILEHDDKNYNMVFLAKQLGLPKSTFSKCVKKLVENGLVDKYKQSGNHKDIILKLTAKGRKFYEVRSNIILESGWKEPFAILDSLSDESLQIMVQFMTYMAADLEPENNKVMELMKLT